MAGVDSFTGRKNTSDPYLDQDKNPIGSFEDLISHYETLFNIWEEVSEARSPLLREKIKATLLELVPDCISWLEAYRDAKEELPTDDAESMEGIYEDSRLVSLGVKRLGDILGELREGSEFVITFIHPDLAIDSTFVGVGPGIKCVISDCGEKADRFSLEIKTGPETGREIIVLSNEANKIWVSSDLKEEES